MNYDDLKKKLRSRRVCVQSGGDLEHGFPLMREAAEAIEKLQGDLSYWTEAYWDLWRKRQWISVQERLPEQPGDYIVFLKSPERIREQWLEYGFDDDGSYVATAFYNDSQRIWEMENDAYNTDLRKVDMDDDYAITHWMPKPPRPDHIGDANEMVVGEDQ